MAITLKPLFREHWETDSMFSVRKEKRLKILKDGGYRDDAGVFIEVNTGQKKEKPVPLPERKIFDEDGTEEFEPEGLRDYLGFIVNSPKGKALWKSWANQNVGAAIKFAVEAVEGKAISRVEVKSTSLTMLQVNPTPTEIDLLRRQVLKTLETQTVEVKRLPAPVPSTNP